MIFSKNLYICIYTLVYENFDSCIYSVYMSIFFFLVAHFGQKACADFERFFSKKTPQNEFDAFLQEKVNFPLLKAFRRISLVLKTFDAFLPTAPEN